jgi:hypothetical protein
VIPSLRPWNERPFEQTDLEGGTGSKFNSASDGQLVTGSVYGHVMEAKEIVDSGVDEERERGYAGAHKKGDAETAETRGETRREKG